MTRTEQAILPSLLRILARRDSETRSYRAGEAIRADRQFFKDRASAARLAADARYLAFQRAAVIGAAFATLALALSI